MRSRKCAIKHLNVTTKFVNSESGLNVNEILRHFEECGIETMKYDKHFKNFTDILRHLELQFQGRLGAIFILNEDYTVTHSLYNLDGRRDRLYWPKDRKSRLLERIFKRKPDGLNNKFVVDRFDRAKLVSLEMSFDETIKKLKLIQQADCGL